MALENTKSIHILYVSAFSQWGGSTISLLHRIQNLDSKVYRVTVVVPIDGPMVEKYRAADARVEIISLSILLRFSSIIDVFTYILGFIPSIARLYRFIKKNDVDVVHSNDSIILVGGIAAKFAGVPSITHIRDDIKKPAWVVHIRNKVISYFSDCIIAVAGAIKEYYIAFGGEESKTCILYDGVLLDKFKPMEGMDELRDKMAIPRKARVVTHIARFDPNKGQECVAKAAVSVIKTIPDVYFLFVGDNNVSRFNWYKNKVLDFISKKDLQGQIIFTGKQDNIEQLINISDIVVLPSAYEALPGVICEASACEKPVIASEVGGLSEIIKNGETGFFIGPQDNKALAALLIQLLSDPERAESMGRRGRQYMEEKFNIRSLTRKLENIYRDLVPYQKNI